MTIGSQDSPTQRRLLELVVLGGGRREFVHELLFEFKAQAPSLLSAMEGGCKANDAKQAGDAAHKLKGSCRELGFTNVQNLCDNFEQMCRHKDIASASVVLIEIQTSFPSIEVEITNFLGEHSAC
jgi:HPt (histidine-containing phosphotransfer) domain-containing protein